MSVRFCVMYSGGLTSWAAARRIVDVHGTDGVVLLFADTKIEDPDLYRFLGESSALLGLSVTRIEDGRTPWQTFRDARFIGNTRVDICSRTLKRDLLDCWRNKHCDQGTTTLVFGLDWSERHRIIRHRERMKPWHALYPLDEKPYVTKADIAADLATSGVRQPALYDEGFPHNNCGGFCVKMGLAQARHLYRVRPATYLHHEAEERETMRLHPRTRPFLRLRKHGRTRGISMEAFRKLIEQQPMLFDNHGWGCGGRCAIDD